MHEADEPLVVHEPGRAVSFFPDRRVIGLVAAPFVRPPPRAPGPDASDDRA